MSDGFQFLDIILFAAIAAFFVIRLRSVLGKRTGHKKKPDYDPFKAGRDEKEAPDKVIHLPDRDKSRAGRAAREEDEPFEMASGEASGEQSPLAAGLTQIKLADRSFDEEGFVAGARAAFEMIVNSFAQSDTDTLRPLLSNEVYENFAGAIQERQEANQQLETTLIGIAEIAIIEAELKQKTAFVTVKFVSEQINVTRDETGEVVDGDPSKVAKITDIWTFARNTRSRDPNWTLVATSSAS